VAGKALGVAETLMLNAAGAVEMVHTYSLIHDDLPSMDNDDYRRGKLTNHKVFGEAVAILAGNALLTQSFELITDAPYKPEIKSHLIQMLARSAGPAGMIGGQVLDMVNESRTLSKEELEQLHSMKTAALIRFAALAAPLIAEADQKTEDSFRLYGSSLGLAFQIVDDVLDIESTTEVLGKTAGKDQQNKKVTYPSLIGVQASNNLASTLIDQACAAVERFDRNSELQMIARHVLTRKN
jgi:geranylgeranyl pyrophosphate synthase